MKVQAPFHTGPVVQWHRVGNLGYMDSDPTLADTIISSPHGTPMTLARYIALRGLRPSLLLLDLLCTLSAPIPPRREKQGRSVSGPPALDQAGVSRTKLRASRRTKVNTPHLPASPTTSSRPCRRHPKSLGRKRGWGSGGRGEGNPFLKGFPSPLPPAAGGIPSPTRPRRGRRSGRSGPATRRSRVRRPRTRRR